MASISALPAAVLHMPTVPPRAACIVVPYPGDGRVLWPHEVTPAVESEEAEDV